MRVTCFGSGSNGNSLLVQSVLTSVLIDSGVPIRLLRAGLRQAGVQDGQLDAVLISHEHHDHVRSLPQIARYQPVTFFGTPGTIRAVGGRSPLNWQTMSATATFTVGDLEITPLEVSHDAEEPVGFLIANGDCRVAIFTDLGEPNVDVASALNGAALVVLESNYDEGMLRSGRYPEHLKRRIRGPLGHLANHVCADLMARAIDGRTLDVWLAHLSENNNRPQIARAVAEASLVAAALRPNVTTLPRFGETISWDSSTATARPRQTTLF